MNYIQVFVVAGGKCGSTTLKETFILYPLGILRNICSRQLRDIVSRNAIQLF